jgi:hypothetical protein
VSESSNGSMEDAPASLPGHCKQLPTADTPYTTISFGVGPGSPKRDQVRTSSGGGAATAAMSPAQTAAVAANAPAAGNSPIRLQPRPPSVVNSKQGSMSCGDNEGAGAGSGLSSVPSAAPTPGLKTLRTMRRRVSEPAAASSPRTSARTGAAAELAAASDSSCSPTRTAGNAVAAKLPSHRLRISNASEGGSSPLRQVKAVASASLERSVIDSEMESKGNLDGVGAGITAVGASSDSCALRDCAPTPGRRSALPRVSS